jgi:sialate O-acetylesterase
MEWSVGPHVGNGIANHQQEIADASWPKLRLFAVQRNASIAQSLDCQGSWSTCSPETVTPWSATAYFFGRELVRELDVPVGLIQTCWGGTVAEAWMSPWALERFGEFGPALDRLAAAQRDPQAAADTVAAKQAAWWEQLDARDPGSAAGGWMDPELDDAAWRAVPVPATWSGGGLERFDGAVWYRRVVDLPAAWEGRGLELALGPIDDMDTTWFNGRRIGGHESDGQHQTPRRYEVPGELVRAGANVIAVRAVDTGGPGGIYGRPEQLTLSVAGDPPLPALSLAGEWRLKPGAALVDVGEWPSSGWFHQDYPTALFNGMIVPILPYAMRGVIWYQGESNRTRAAQYRELFPALIEDWRSLWGLGDFPFYFVQIAPFGYGGDTGQAAELRDAQRLALRVPSTGMAVTMDIGNPADIHPANKQDVGARLALWALAKDYGREGLVYSGPLYRSMKVDGASIRLSFDYVADGLMSGGGDPTHFTIAGADRVFHPASARIDGDEIVVSSDAVPEPVAVRFAWEAAAEPNLFNSAGLPASSFRTDDWE